MLVHTYLDAVSHASIDDELSVNTHLITALAVFVRWLIGGFEDHQEGLNDVITMHVHDKLISLLVQGRYDSHQGSVALRCWKHAQPFVLFDRHSR